MAVAVVLLLVAAPSWRAAAAQSCLTDDPPCPPPPPLSVGVQAVPDTMRVNPGTVYFTATGLGAGGKSASATVDGVPVGAPTWQYESNGASANGSVQVNLGVGTHTVAITFCESGRTPSCASDQTQVSFLPLPAPPLKDQPVADQERGSRHRRSLAGCAGCAYTELSYSTPAYRSRDVKRSLTLRYSSALSAPAGQVVMDVNPNSAETPAAIQLTLYNAGAPVWLLTGGDIFFTAKQGMNRLTALFDASGLPTTTLNLTAVVRNWYTDGTTRERHVGVRAMTINHRASPFGSGWSITGLPTLHLPLGENGDAMFVENGQATVFTNCGQGCWTPPPGEGSAFYWGSPGRLRRHYLDGTDAEFESSTLRLVEIRDRLGMTTRYAYDGSGRITQITDVTGLVTTIAWAAAGGGGHTASITTPGGRTSVVHVNAAGELTQIVDPDGVRALAVTYTGGRITSATNRINATTDYAYDRYGGLASVTAPAILTDSLGWVRPQTTISSREYALVDMAGVNGSGSGSNPVRHISPDSVWTVMRTPRGAITRVATNGAADVLRTVTVNAAGKVDSTVIGYNFLDQPASVWSTSGIRKESRWNGSLISQIVDNVANVTTDYYYNDFGQLTGRRVNQEMQERHTYSADSRSLLDSTRSGTTLVRHTYDALGRVLTTTDGGQHQTSYSYEPGGFQNLASVTKNGATTQFAYDAFGRSSTVTDALGQASSVVLDLLGRPSTATAPARGTSSWSYDDGSRTYTFTDGRQQQYTTITNALGATVAEHNPYNPSLSDQYRYDSDGNLSSYTTRAQRTGQIDRDILGRPIRIKLAGSVVTSISYDTARKWTAYSTAESIDTIFVDGDGRVTKQTTFRSGGPSTNPGLMRFTTLTTYGAQGQKRSITISSPLWNGVEVRSETDVDALGRPNYVGAFDGSWTSIAYNPDEAPQTITFPQSGTATRRRQSLTYTGGDQIASSTSNVAGDALSWSYNYDALGRMWLLAQGQGTYAKVRTAEYDGASRLGHWTDYRTVELPPQWICDDPYSDELSNCYWYTGTESQAVRDEYYTYDAAGNRTDLGAGIVAGNRLTYFNGYTMQYDEDGNLVSKTGNGLTQSFQWNGLGQLVTVTTNGSTATYAYDGLGRRVRKTVNGVTTRYLHDGDNLVVQMNGAGARQLEFSYYPGIDQPHSVRQSATGNLYYYSTSQPGHVTALVSRTNQVVNRYEYAPFGAAISTTEQVSQPFRFAGRELDAETGLYYNRARYYDPAVGRFISEDPIGLRGGVNTYSYADNDPISKIDPYGTCTLMATIRTTYYSDGSTTVQVLRYFWEGDDCDSGGGGGNAPKPDVVKKPSRTMACNRSASTVMAALQNNFNDFASFSSPFAPALAFNAPAHLEVGTSIPITMFAAISGNLISYGTSVTVKSMSPNSLTFATVPGHSLYPGTISFSASPAGQSQIQFGVSISGTFANLGWAAGYYLGGSAYENAIWNNLMNNVGTFCGSSR